MGERYESTSQARSKHIKYRGEKASSCVRTKECSALPYSACCPDSSTAKFLLNNNVPLFAPSSKRMLNSTTLKVTLQPHIKVDDMEITLFANTHTLATPTGEAQ